MYIYLLVTLALTLASVIKHSSYAVLYRLGLERPFYLISRPLELILVRQMKTVWSSTMHSYCGLCPCYGYIVRELCVLNIMLEWCMSLKYSEVRGNKLWIDVLR